MTEFERCMRAIRLEMPESVCADVERICRAALAAAHRRGQEAMRARAAREADCGCPGADAVTAATTKADRWRACPRDPCGRDTADAIRALEIEG